MLLAVTTVYSVKSTSVNQSRQQPLSVIDDQLNSTTKTSRPAAIITTVIYVHNSMLVTRTPQRFISVSQTASSHAARDVETELAYTASNIN